MNLKYENKGYLVLKDSRVRSSRGRQGSRIAGRKIISPLKGDVYYLAGNKTYDLTQDPTSSIIAEGNIDEYESYLKDEQMPIRNAYELSNNHPQKSISATKVKPKPIKKGIIGGVGLQSPSELLKYKHVFESSDALSFDKIVQFLHKSPHGDDYTPSKTSQAHVIKSSRMEWKNSSGTPMSCSKSTSMKYNKDINIRGNPKNSSISKTIRYRGATGSMGSSEFRITGPENSRSKSSSNSMYIRNSEKSVLDIYGKRGKNCSSVLGRRNANNAQNTSTRQKVKENGWIDGGSISFKTGGSPEVADVSQVQMESVPNIPAVSLFNSSTKPNTSANNPNYIHKNSTRIQRVINNSQGAKRQPKSPLKSYLVSSGSSSRKTPPLIRPYSRGEGNSIPKMQSKSQRLIFSPGRSGSSSQGVYMDMEIGERYSQDIGNKSISLSVRKRGPGERSRSRPKTRMHSGSMPNNYLGIDSHTHNNNNDNNESKQKQMHIAGGSGEGVGSHTLDGRRLEGEEEGITRYSEVVGEKNNTYTYTYLTPSKPSPSTAILHLIDHNNIKHSEYDNNQEDYDYKLGASGAGRTGSGTGSHTNINTHTGIGTRSSLSSLSSLTPSTSSATYNKPLSPPPISSTTANTNILTQLLHPSTTKRDNSRSISGPPLNIIHPPLSPPIHHPLDDNKITLSEWIALSNIYNGHNNTIRDIGVRGAEIWSASADRTIRVWNIPGYRMQGVASLCMGHKGPVCCLLPVNRGALMLSGGNAGYLKMWDGESKTLIHQMKRHTSSINHMALLGNSTLITASNDHTLRGFDLNKMCNLDLPTMSHASSILKVSAIGVHSLLSGDLNGNLMKWDTRAKEKCPIWSTSGHNSRVSSIIQYGSVIISSDYDGNIKLWDVRSIKPNPVAFFNANHNIYNLIKINNKLLAASDQGLKIFDMGSKFKLIGSKNSHDGSVRCLYYNSDSSILYSGGFDKSIISWKVNQSY